MSKNLRINIILLVIGALIGFALCWFIFVKRHTAQATTTTVEVEKHAEEISEVVSIIKYDTRYVYLTNKVDTDYYGMMTTSTVIEREQFLYTHKINVQVMLMTTSVHIGVGYQYKNWMYNLYYGIDYKLIPSYGLGVGYQFNIK